MFSKRIKIILISVLVMILAVVLIFSFGLKRKKPDAGNVVNPDGKTIAEKKVEDIISEDENILNILSELKSSYPQLSESQVEFYRETAKHSINFVGQCSERADKNDCIASMAFIKGNSGICIEIQDQDAAMGCADMVLEKRSEWKIDRCKSLGGGEYVNCLGQIFLIYNKIEDCSNLNSESMRKTCEEIFLYRKAFVGRDMKICSEITDDKLKNFCLENKMIKDSDGDGLSDGNETLKYKTDPNNSDTDGDGYSDGDEVKNGFNPLGAGKME
jgi:hypothetical protein